MGSKTSTVLAWIGGAIALAVAAVVLASPHARYRLTLNVQQLVDAVNSALRELETRMRGGYERDLAALQELGPTMDTATTQFEASMVVSKVSSALASEPRLRGRPVGVRMIGGILHLEGQVESPDEKALASEVARRSSGAELVANDLKVISPTP
jgi:osmotically-inducible protein OsmY